MAKIIFVEGEKHQAQEAEASAGDTMEIFKLAEQLSEAELERIKRTVNKFAQNLAKNCP